MEYIVDHKLFICDTLFSVLHGGKFSGNFRRKFPDCTMPCITMTHNVVTKLRCMGLALGRKKHKRRYVQTEDKFYASTRLEANPMKLLCHFALQCGLIKRTAHIDISCRSYIAQNCSPPPPPCCEARTRYSRWFQISVFNGILHLELSFYSDQVLFILSGCVKGQSNRHWNTKDSYVHEVPLLNLKFGFGV
jgi:hypothetical protein